MNICVFDTETTSLDKPFCYNIGYIIADAESGNVLIEKEFVVEQIWHNLPLFNTAYYADKRPIYVNRMRKREVIMNKFGYICQEMIRDFNKFDVHFAYAYNSNFDEKVFNFNCDWFKCNNPFDDIEIFDIRGYVHNFLIDDNFKNWCELNKEFTDTGNYSTTAETLFRYVSSDYDFKEEHTALSDSKIEFQILLMCIVCGADITKESIAKRSIERTVERTLHIKTNDNDFYFNYEKIRINKERTEITLK